MGAAVTRDHKQERTKVDFQGTKEKETHMGSKDHKEVRGIRFIDPDEIVIIGLDTDDGPDHPLYDPRALEEPPQSLIDSIRKNGFESIVQVRKDGDRFQLIAGRKRVLATREVNKDRREPVLVKADVKKAENELDFFGMMVRENQLRTQENPANAARKAVRMAKFGADEKKICDAFGWTPQQHQSYTSLLDLDNKILKAVESDEVSFSAATLLAALPREEQVAEFDKLKAEGKLTVAGAKVAVKNAKSRKESEENGDPAKKTNYIPPGSFLIRKIFEAIEAGPEKYPEVGRLGEVDLRSVLRWIYGAVSAKAIPGLTPLINRFEEEKAERAEKKVKAAKKKAAKARALAAAGVEPSGDGGDSEEETTEEETTEEVTQEADDAAEE